MRVLFVSGGKFGDASFLIKNQAESLTKKGIEVDFFIIGGKGILGYLKSIPKLRKKVNKVKYDIVHAHYSFSAFAASLAGQFPLVVSLMGSDVYMSTFWRWFVRIFCYLRWNATIVKTKQMKELLKISKVFVIPNGVNIKRYSFIEKTVAREKIKYFSEKKLVIFIADPSRPEKNFTLAKQAVDALNSPEIVLLTVYNVSNELIPYYLNAADVLLLTSKWEGSVNVIKEAMACNCPIVATDVGDIKLVVGQTEGCYVTSFNPIDIAEKLKLAIEFNRRTNGRDRIISLGLDSETIANKIIDIYKKVINKNAKKKLNSNASSH